VRWGDWEQKILQRRLKFGNLWMSFLRNNRPVYYLLGRLTRTTQAGFNSMYEKDPYYLKRDDEKSNILDRDILIFA